jgi:hypothetical protein
LFLTILNTSADELNKNGAVLSSDVSDFSKDVGVLFGAAGLASDSSYLADSRFMFLELIFGIYTFIYTLIIEKLCPNGTACDLSYLIFSLNVSTI